MPQALETRIGPQPQRRANRAKIQLGAAVRAVGDPNTHGRMFGGAVAGLLLSLMGELFEDALVSLGTAGLIGAGVAYLDGRAAAENAPV